jgi:hypothetical protein
VYWPTATQAFDDLQETEVREAVVAPNGSGMDRIVQLFPFDSSVIGTGYPTG